MGASNMIFPDGTTLQEYLDQITGINGTSFTIDKDNTSAGVSTSINFNRGSTEASDAQLKWNETIDKFEFIQTTGVLADISVDKIYLGNDNTYVDKNGSGDLELHVASGKAFKFVVG